MMRNRSIEDLGASLALAAGLTLLCGGSAKAQETNLTPVAPGVFSVSYFDVATSASPSRAGFGGPGSSGGAGDNAVRITNPTAANGTLCAMIYVFDDFAEMQACCGCPVTSNGVRTLSVTANLTFDFAVSRANLNAGMIYLISALPNFAAGDPSPPPASLGTNGCAIDSSTGLPTSACFLKSPGCDPEGEFDRDKRAGAINPTSGLAGWITHDELAQPGLIPGHPLRGASSDAFRDSPLEAAHLTALESLCSVLISNGSGSGACICGTGDDAPAPGPVETSR